MHSASNQPLPTLPPTPANPTAPPPGLTPAQQKTYEDVEKLLEGVVYNSWEIERLILAGYTNLATIAAIIKGGLTSYTVFLDPKTAKLMNELTTAQQLKFITMVNAYQTTHPGLTSHQVYNALSFIKMKAQLSILSNDITGQSGDPISQAIASAFPSNVNDLNSRLQQDVPLNGVSDPFVVTDAQLKGWYANLTGISGEWLLIKHYHQEGSLVNFSVPITGGEVDIKISENGVEKWVEVKNALTSNAWGKAVKQAGKYAQSGATDVVIALPQQGVNGTSDLSSQQLNNLRALERQYPNVKFEVRTGANDPSIQIPFDPSAINWGSYIP
jgi:hypothetical protein